MKLLGPRVWTFLRAYCQIITSTFYYSPRRNSKNSTMKILTRTDLWTLVTHLSLYFWVVTTGTLSLKRKKKKSKSCERRTGKNKKKKKDFWIKGKLIRDGKRIRQAGRSQQQTVRCDTIKTGSLSWDSPRT